MSVLLQLARERNWPSIVERMYMHPLEIFDRDTNGWSVFHHVCYRSPPLYVIRELLGFLEPIEPSYSNMDIDSDDDSDYGGEYNEETGERFFTMKPNNSGCTALHYACQYSSPEVVMEIIRLHPYAVSVTDSEDLTTLHYACMSENSNNRPHGIFAKALMLLNIDPLLVTKNQLTSPITLYCEKYEMEIKAMLNSNAMSKESESSFIEFWKVLVLLVSFATGHDDQITIEMAKSLFEANFSTFPLLHPLLKLPNYCKPSSLFMDVFLAILKIYPQQAQIVDMNGDLPIHRILSKHDEYPHDELPLLIQALLSAHSQAAKCKGSSGKLPIHLAVENGLKIKHGIKYIISAYPEVVGSFVSNNERLFPFLLSEAANGKSPNLTFELLRAQPSLVSQAMSSD